MKKLITIALCFALAACVLTGCGRTEDMKTTDTTTTPSITATQPTTHSTIPMTESTQPSTTSGTQDIPETSSMPNDADNGAGSNNDPGSPRSRAHYPSVIDRSR